MNYQIECDVAVAAIKRASVFCESVRTSHCQADGWQKDDRSPVTVADFGTQALILSELNKAFPDDPVVAEENGSMLRGDEGMSIANEVARQLAEVDYHLPQETLPDLLDTGGVAVTSCDRFWTLDPVDGTKGFLRGDQYALALSLIEHGRPVLGVLGCPSLTLPGMEKQGVVCHAIREQGARMEQVAPSGVLKTLNVRSPGSFTDLVFCESFEKAHTSQTQAARVAQRLGVLAEAVRMDSQCKYAVVAAGAADVYLRLSFRQGYTEKIWDHAAGVMILQEAGGRVTDATGQELDFTHGRTLSHNRGVVATNGWAHQAVVDAVLEECFEGEAHV